MVTVRTKLNLSRYFSYVVYDWMVTRYFHDCYDNPKVDLFFHKYY